MFITQIYAALAKPKYNLEFIKELLKEVKESKKDGQINHHTDSVRIMVITCGFDKCTKFLF